MNAGCYGTRDQGHLRRSHRHRRQGQQARARRRRHGLRLSQIQRARRLHLRGSRVRRHAATIPPPSAPAWRICWRDREASQPVKSQDRRLDLQESARPQGLAVDRGSGLPRASASATRRSPKSTATSSSIPARPAPPTSRRWAKRSARGSRQKFGIELEWEIKTGGRAMTQESRFCSAGVRRNAKSAWSSGARLRQGAARGRLRCRRNRSRRPPISPPSSTPPSPTSCSTPCTAAGARTAACRACWNCCASPTPIPACWPPRSPCTSSAPRTSSAPPACRWSSPSSPTARRPPPAI